MDTPLLFILSSILGKEFKSISAKIGFKQTKPKKDPSVLNILLQLKKANKKYFKNLEKFKYFYISAENGNIQNWEFLLDNDYYGKKYIWEKNKVILSLKQYFIYVSFYVKQILNNDFFKELYDKTM